MGRPSMENFGNHLNRIVYSGRSQLFEQSELAELTYGAFNIAVTSLQQSTEETIIVSFPIGWRADNQPLSGTRSYSKSDLIGRYQSLAFDHLPINGLIQLVTIAEALLSDIVRSVVLQHPRKLGGKRNVPMQIVLEATSIEDIHLRATDAFVNELSYKSPADYAEAVESILSIKLLECAAFHRYMEIKASRDILIHAQGIANDTYVRKAASHARVKAGEKLPVSIQYFLQSYEACLQLSEWIEQQLHERWYSSEFEDRQRQIPLPFKPSMVTQLATAVPSPSSAEAVLDVPALEPPLPD